MEPVEVVVATGSSVKSGQAVWTVSMTTKTLGFLADLVASGKRTSSGFRIAHHNQCAAFLVSVASYKDRTRKPSYVE